MAKGSKKKKHNSKKKDKTKSSIPPPTGTLPITVVTPSGESPKKRKWYRRGWVIFSGILLIAAGLTYIKPIRDLFISKRSAYEEENFRKGTINALEIRDSVKLDYDTLELKERPIFNKARRDSFPIVKGIKIREDRGDMIVISVGSGFWWIGKEVVKKGIKIFSPASEGDCAQTTLNLIIKDGRAYVSAVFKDLRKEEFVGEMYYNRWKVYLKNLLDYDYDDDRLEVRDKQGYVIFSILFSNEGSPNGVIAISGYFIDPNSVLIVNTDQTPRMYTPKDRSEMLSKRVCITKDTIWNWRSEAEKRISKIVSVFDPKKATTPLETKGIPITLDDTVISP